MSEEDDAQASDSEARRVAQAYAAYRADPRRAAAWSAENPGNLAIRHEVSEAIWRLIGPHAEAGILDVGCGTGWWLEELAARTGDASKLAGLDLQPERVEAARGKCPGADVREGDARRLPWPDDSFGAVTLLLALSSMGQPMNMSAALREARRVVVPGGLVVVWEPRWPAPRGGRLTVSAGFLRQALAPIEAEFPITLVPVLARRLGERATATWYPRLARISLLRSHRLVAGRST